jgi:hypothetical protein
MVDCARLRRRVMAEKIGIFVSHHHSQDEDAFTARLVADLEAAGADVWVDTSGIASGSFVDKINQGLVGRQWLVLIMTPESLASRWVHLEVDAALNQVVRGRMLGVIPVVAAPCVDRDIPILWDALHRYDATEDYGAARDGLLVALGLSTTSSNGSRPKRQWDEATFFRAIATQGTRLGSPRVSDIAREMYTWAQRTVDGFWWGKGLIDGSCYVQVSQAGKSCWIAALWTNGVVEIPFKSMSTGPFAQEIRRKELIARLNTVPGISIGIERLHGAPNIPLSIFADHAALLLFLSVLEWAVTEIRKES